MTLYLTKIQLDAVVYQNRKISSEYEIHKFVYSCFPREENAGRFLYVNRGSSQRGRYIVVLILSKIMPVIPENVQFCTREICESYFQTDCYDFEILLNPVKRFPETKKRTAILERDDLRQWFFNLSEKHGFSVKHENLMLQILPSLNFPKGKKSEMICRFHQVKFSGTLNVQDRELFLDAAINGIGHGKAFGFGLLQLIPVWKG